jgi:acyl-CoA reductase-like NAD-dependent aldehyde dehydrogenase
VIGAFSQSGQSCISVQRIMVHESIYERFKPMLVAKTKELKSGDPKFEETDVGPLISEQEAIRLENWIQKAIANGGNLLCGGKRLGSVFEATLLENVPESELICCEEAFGPVAILSPFHDLKDAIAQSNRTRFGLQAGLFTRSLPQAFHAWDDLEVGGVCINEVPSWRADIMPYGGVKDSGIGREGIRFAMEEMTEMRSLVIRDLMDYSPK